MGEFSWSKNDVVRNLAMFLDQKTACEVINERGELLNISVQLGEITAALRATANPDVEEV
jgi:hypothetical protein